MLQDLITTLYSTVINAIKYRSTHVQIDIILHFTQQ